MNARAAKPQAEVSLGRIQSRTLRKASPRDWLWALGLLALASATVWLGRRAADYLEPTSVQELEEMVRGFELPRVLPDAPLVDEAGRSAGLLSRLRSERAVLAFYAPWCGPCQEELPMLYQGFGHDEGQGMGAAQLLVVIPKGEDSMDTRRKLDNLGLDRVRFVADKTGKLAKGGKVTSLPTAFVLDRRGKVLTRTTGYSLTGLGRLRAMAMVEPDGQMQRPRSAHSTDEHPKAGAP